MTRSNLYVFFKTFEMEAAGPSLTNCKVCHFSARSISEHIQHQRIHDSGFNFHYDCPVFACHSTFTSFGALNSHVSHHSVARNELIGNVVHAGVKCELCEAVQACNRNLCDHVMNDHLKKGEFVLCPLRSTCKVTRHFKSVLQLRPHLSQFHPGWTKDLNRIGALSDHCERNVHEDFGGGGEDFDFRAESDIELEGSSMDGDWDSDSDSDSSSVSDYDGSLGYSDGLVTDYIAKFYAKLEGKLFVPKSTVQKICNAITFLSEILQHRYKEVLIARLKKEKLSDDQIESVITSALESDVLFNVHHKNAVGEKLCSEHLRSKYYKKHFQYVEAEEINLNKRDPHDRSAVVHYVPVKETLRVMTEDPSVQVHIDKSFEGVTGDPNVIKDYTDGSVFKKRNPPSKRIDVFIFQDSFLGAINALGSAKVKYKTLGVYMNLGNLPAPLRSRLKAKRAVFLTLENNTKEEVIRNGLEKCFRRMVNDLKDLEINGMYYKGELVAVRVQFLLGDNLGQHTVGGYLESLSSHYFCRSCHITRLKFHEDADQEEPVFRKFKWRTKSHHTRALVKKGDNYSYKGIKQRSIFNELNFFNVCDPGQPGCIGHDLFIGGVVDCDMASMMRHFIKKKKWFTLQEINRRIDTLRCRGNDVGNKPANVHQKFKKLGGHAVQNWCLLRLLPFIVGDLVVDTSDPVWQLYLLLKRACELICAPGLSRTQIDQLRLLLDEYMQKRKCLRNGYKPKHHFFHHLADHYEMFGPPIFLWTLGFEQYHQIFKRVGRKCNNYINLIYSFMRAHQLMQAYQSTGILFPQDAMYKAAFPLVPESLPDVVQTFVNSCSFSPDAVVVQGSLTINDIKYREGDHLLLGPEGTGNIFVGKIKMIIHDSGVYHLVVFKSKAKLRSEYGVYRVKKESEIAKVALDSNLENPCPHGVYEFQGKLCLSLKHVFIEV